MSIASILNFLPAALDEADACWQEDRLDAISHHQAPEQWLLGARGSLLRGDLHIVWARWFIESLCDPERFVTNYPGYAELLAQVLAPVKALVAADYPEDEIKKLASLVARLLDKEVQRRQADRRTRDETDYPIRHALWDIYGPKARCYICGYEFEAPAVSAFLGTRDTLPPFALPPYVDFFKPRGLNARDFRIEIEHVVPVAAGGGGGGGDLTNLRLACGWCNASKSDKMLVYDVSSTPLHFQHPRLGRITRPHPFWVIRLLATRRRCEYTGGCDRNVTNEELTVVPKNVHGALNPVNLRLTCQAHDPLSGDRLVRTNQWVRSRNRRARVAA